MASADGNTASREMMIRHEHRDTEVACRLDSLDARDAVVDGHDQRGLPRRSQGDDFRRQPIAEPEAVRHQIVHMREFQPTQRHAPPRRCWSRRPHRNRRRRAHGRLRWSRNSAAAASTPGSDPIGSRRSSDRSRSSSSDDAACRVNPPQHRMHARAQLGRRRNRPAPDLTEFHRTPTKAAVGAKTVDWGPSRR